MAKTQSKSMVESSRLSRGNQIVIPAKIRRALGIKGGDELSWRLIPADKQAKVLVEPKPKSWAKYTKGLGKKVWKEVNIEQYIENLRREWELQR